MKTPLFIRRHTVGLTVLVLITTTVASWTTCSPKWFARPISSYVSPDGRYRLDTLEAFYLTSSNYGFARLYDTRTSAFMCESGVEWTMDNSRVRWPDKNSREVSVGMDIHLALDEEGTQCTVRIGRHTDPLP